MGVIRLARPARRPTPGSGPISSRGCAGAEINRDGNLRLQYLAGLALNISMEGAIYNEMLGYRRFPQNLFVGSEARVRNLMYAFGGQ